MLYKAEPTIPTLTTERLTLRQLLESDVAELFLLRSDEAVNKYLDRKPAANTEDALNFIRNVRNNKLLYWAITATKKAKLIGTVCLFDFSDEGTECEIGFELLPAQQGKGFMYEAAKKIIAFAESTLAVKTMDAFTHKNNPGSINLLEKLGFEQIVCSDDANADLLRFRLSVNEQIG